MATLYLTKHVSSASGQSTEAGAKLDLLVETEAAASDHSSSSSRTIDVSSSSSSAGATTSVASLFLHRRVDGRDYFLDICSPSDLESWPVGAPDTTTGLYRLNHVSLTFRSEETLEAAYEELWRRISKLADAMTSLNALKEAETRTIDPTATRSGSSSSSSDDNGGFTLIRDALTLYPPAAPASYRLHISCESSRYDPKIFLWRADLPDPDATVRQRPTNVCSAGDMVDYPADAPAAAQFPASYRLAEWDICSSNVPLLEETWQRICAATTQLARTLAAHANVTTTEYAVKEYDDGQ